ncbi:MAG TPA: glycosyltransferase [Gaiellaceae bacterium]|nr:glycosyltransferase [Gaiellaceae bacterium]
MRPAISVVVSTYEWPEALDAVLGALAEQTERPFEVIIADDGSGPATAAVVERWGTVPDLRIKHVWQPKNGWRKSRILNLGALEAEGDYLLFLDGDSLPRRRMLEATRKGALANWFLASKRVHLSPGFTKRVLAGEIRPSRWPAPLWLLRAPRELLTTDREVARVGLVLPVRDRRRPWRPQSQDFQAILGAYGFYFGVWRESFERVNGFDMRFTGWGGEDEDIAARLRHAGVRCGWPGASATMLHLWHPPMRGTSPSNSPLIHETTAAGRVEAIDGLRELRGELARSQLSA